jgi:hypothetical protein
MLLLGTTIVITRHWLKNTKLRHCRPSARMYFPEIHQTIECQLFFGTPICRSPLRFVTEILYVLLLSSVYLGILTFDHLWNQTIKILQKQTTVLV